MFEDMGGKHEERGFRGGNYRKQRGVAVQVEIGAVHIDICPFRIEMETAVRCLFRRQTGVLDPCPYRFHLSGPEVEVNVSADP